MQSGLELRIEVQVVRATESITTYQDLQRPNAQPKQCEQNGTKQRQGRKAAKRLGRTHRAKSTKLTSAAQRKGKQPARGAGVFCKNKRPVQFDEYKTTESMKERATRQQGNQG